MKIVIKLIICTTLFIIMTVSIVYILFERDLGLVDKYPSTIINSYYSNNTCYFTIYYKNFAVNEYTQEIHPYKVATTEEECTCTAFILNKLSHYQKFTAYPNDKGDWHLAAC